MCCQPLYLFVEVLVTSELFIYFIVVNYSHQEPTSPQNASVMRLSFVAEMITYTLFMRIHTAKFRNNIS